MKKIQWRILLFIVLALVLATGTSYLALNHKVKKEDETSAKKMAVAVVNEDQGTTFEGQKINFGDQFIKNISKNDKQQWYVVSRGIAESGLKNNNYNMMIVIPNDFSQKAVAINSDSPEKVTISYKINATGNKDLKAEAENTAASILEEFNKHIVDVYFASIIGNLQGAQDNIQAITNKEQAQLNVYKTDVHSPLANYTQQFKTVQDYTGVSIDTFKGFQGVLNGFEQNIDGTSQSNLAFQNSFGNFQKTQGENSLAANNFSNQLNQFNSDLSTEDVLKRLETLELTNKAIADQFTLADKNANILSDSAAIKDYLTDVNGKIRSYDADLAEKLNSDIQAATREKLKKDISDEDQKAVYLNTLMQQPNDEIKKKIEQLINHLPSVSMEEIDQLSLPDETKRELKNVIQVTGKYNTENQFNPEGTGQTPLGNTIKTIKEGLATNGVIFNDVKKVPKMDAAQTFTLNLPSEFGLYSNSQSLLINGKDYTEEFLSKGTVTLPAREEGNLDVRVHVKLLDPNANIDVFTPVNWQWNLDHKYEKKTTTESGKPSNPNGKEEAGKTGNTSISAASQKVTKTEQTTDTNSNNLPKDSNNPNKGDGTKPADPNKGDGTKPADPNKGDGTKPADPNKGDGTKPADPNKGDGTTPSDPNKGDGTTPGDPNKDKTKLETIERTNDRISHQKAEYLYPDSTNVLISDSVKTVQAYEQLLSLYELYYGFDMKAEDLATKLEEGTLSDQAAPDSLYYILNKQDIVDVMATFIANEITAEITAETNDLKQKVDTYMQLVDNADQNSEHLAEVLKQTTEQAQVMNATLGEYLKNVAAWRENSLKLANEQKVVATNRDGEQTAVLGLDSEFKSLLTQSQALGDMSKGNLLAADNVYKTFDEINNQAKEIQDSGVTVVSKANTLLDDYSEKVADDKDFSKNFAKVLSNSRVGERQNEDLYQFLASPVQKQNDGTITAGDAFTPYLMVLVCFIVALFTSYAIAHQEKRRSQKDDFAEELSTMLSNVPITAITLGIAIAEGITIGIISGHLLEFDQTRNLMWIGSITMIMAALVLISTYLLRQVKMIGMFVLLTFFSMYLFLTNAVGMNIDKMSYFGKIRKFSPLQYLETFLNNFISGKNSEPAIFGFIIGLAIFGFIINLFVWHRRRGEGQELDDQITESIS
ncbi:type VII secretion protein EsaA [Bacillus rhizoplanae]|uniref:type VII secretion protein EsaA n=2 Tax=Bacillus TaxID=1386 RepID=UPI001E35E1D0|nr:type VII secretion protein EsaA [Bacillus rhizoplanae]